MGWFRSEEMVYMRFLLQKDLAYRCLSQLGLCFDDEDPNKTLGVIQFNDLNMNLTSLQRCQQHDIFTGYAKELKKCDDLERTIDFFQLELSMAGIPIEEPAESLETFLQEVGASDMDILNQVKELTVKIERDLREKIVFIDKHTRDRNHDMEKAHVLEKLLRFTDGMEGLGGLEGAMEGGERKTSFDESNESEGGQLLSNNATGGHDVRFIRMIAGVIPDDDKERFTRAAYRVTRGNFLPEFYDIARPLYDPDTKKEVQKSVFIIIFQDEQIETKLNHLCDAFGAKIYDVPDLRDKAAITTQMIQTRIDIRDSDTTVEKHQDTHRDILMRHVAPHARAWQWQVRREKAIYHALNMFKPPSDGAGTMLVGEGWVLKEKEQQCEAIIKAVGQTKPGVFECLAFREKEAKGTPPTYFRTNEFTGIYQHMVNTYGIPRYREANPAMSTVITFPFLFGVMYGDIGHGTVLFLAALFFIVKEDMFKKGGVGEIVEMVFAGRHMIIMMGAFAIYMGFIYNDIFSLTLDCFGTTWQYKDANTVEAEHKPYVDGNVSSIEDNVYPFGMDPTWHNAENELAFFNSFKMKLSVILGVSQMFCGLIMRTLNAVHFRKWVDLFHECIPMMIFMVSLFGYMCFLIVYKWTQDWQLRDQQPPSLINTMIAILLQPSCPVSFNETTNTAAGCGELPLYEGQQGVQLILLGFAFISVPWLLLAKPIIEGCCQKKDSHHDHDVPEAAMDYIENMEGGDESKMEQPLVAQQHGDEDEHEDHGFGTIMIHQAIETIEYVLGVVSNTASYLRLWALSLAHAELALVFWEKTMIMPIGMDVGAGGGGTFIKGIMIWAGFAVFAMVTLGVLLVMDVLECFLHALRLQWVEFQNKFYHGDGVEFKPFHFVDAVRGAE